MTKTTDIEVKIEDNRELEDNLSKDKQIKWSDYTSDSPCSLT